MFKNIFKFVSVASLLAMVLIIQSSFAQNMNSESAIIEEVIEKAPQTVVNLSAEEISKIKIPNVQVSSISGDGVNAVYLTQDFETAFAGDPAAPPGWTQTRSLLVGDGIPEPNGVDGDKDWQQNIWSGTAWQIAGYATGIKPTGAVSGTSVLYMEDSYFGSTSVAYGSRRLESPSVNLTTSTSPYVRFWYFYNSASSNLFVKVMGSSDGGTTWNKIMTIAPNADVTAMTSATPWQRISIMIPAAYKTANAKFGIEMVNVWGTNDIYIDDFVVEDFTPTTITSAAAGNWSNTATWVGGVIPTSDNNVVIAAGHIVSVDINIARCQNITIDGTFQYGTTSTSQLMHIYGDLIVNATGIHNSFFSTTGKRTMLGGGLINNGAINFSIGAGNLVWLGGAPATYSGTGSLTGTFISNIWHLNSGGVTYNAAVEVRNTCGIYDGPVNPNGLLTVGNVAVTTQTIERTSRGNFAILPTLTGGITRSVSYIYANIISPTKTTYSPGFELPDVGGVGTLGGTFALSTFDNILLNKPVTVGTATTGALTLTRGILITSDVNLLTLEAFIAGPTGTAPSVLTPPSTAGSYIVGPVRINCPASGTTTRNFALGVGTGFNGPTPNSNVLKTVAIAPGATGWANQTLKLSIGSAPGGTINPPLTFLMGPRTYRVDLLGGPDLPATATLSIRGRNSTFGNSDNMYGDQSELRVAQSTSVSGSWFERSLTSGTGGFVNNTDYIRTTAAAAPGPIAPLATYGEYFSLATTATVINPSGVSATPISSSQINVAFTPNIFNNNVVVVFNLTGTFTAPTGAPPVAGQPFAGGTLLYNGTTSPYNHTSLSAATLYYYKLFSYDGANYSPGVTANATTLCEAITTFPWGPIDFEGTIFPPACFGRYSGILANPSTLTTTTSGWLQDDWRNVTTTTNKAGKLNIWSTSTIYWLTTPQINLGTNVPARQIEFDLTLNAYGTSNPPATTGVDDKFAVVISTDGGTTWSSANTLRLWDNAGSPYVYNNINYLGEHISISLAGYSGTVMIGFYGESTVSNADNDLMIDNILIQLPPACPAPTSLTATGVSNNSALIGWAGAATVDIDYGAPGHPAGTGTVVSNVVTNPYSLSGLSAATTYDAYVKQNCGSGNYSTWAGPLQFTTLCDVALAPWTEDFEHAAAFPPPCWTLAGTATSLWINGAASGYGTGTYSAKANFYGVSSGSRDLISFAYDASGMAAQAVRFDWAYATYSGEVDQMDIYYSTDFGGTWNLLLAMPGGTNGILNPFGLVLTGSYTPLAGEWSTKTLILPTDANMVKFTAITAFGNNLYLDNVKIVEPPANDVGTSSIDVASNLVPGSVVPMATVKNFGTATNTFNVQMSITGGYTSTKTVTSLAPGATQQVTFDNWNATLGQYTVKVFTQLGTDTDASNDTLYKNVGVYAGSYTSGNIYPTTTYLGSGVGNSGYLYSIGGNTASLLGTECYKYNVDTDTWTPIASLPAGRRVLATATVGNFVYAIGGSDMSSVYQSTVYKYDIALDIWTAVASLPIALGWIKAVGYNNKIYVAGGVDGASTVVATVYVYDVGTNIWAAATSMPGPKFGGAFSVTGNKLVYAAGANATVISSDVYVGTIDGTDPALIVWTMMSNPYPGISKEVYSDYNGRISELLKPESKELVRDQILPEAATYPPGAMYRFDGAPWGTDQIIVASGSPSAAWVPADPNPTYIYNPTSDTWVKQPDVPIPVLGASLGTVNSGTTWKLIVASGLASVETNVTQIYTVNMGGTTTFDFNLTVANSWNMVSAPGLHPTNQNVTTWWSGKDPAAGVFKYAGGYVAVTTTTPTEGYWMKNLGAQVYNYTGIQIVTHNPINAASGWNLIGGYENIATVSLITTTPPGLVTGSVFGYSGGYNAVTTLVPGYAYWIKLTGAGQINLPSSLSKDGESIEFFKEDWGKIVMTDAAGINYTLYAVKGEVNLGNYELPPAPPAGMFDIRFGSGRIAEDINESMQTIEMTGVTYPVTVRAEGMDMRLMDETGKTINVNLKSGENVVISDATIQKLMVTGELIPAVYALEQNYPNPFNPSTVIEFSLPDDVSNVKLSIYNALGEKVAELVNSSLTAGKYQYQWNAKNVATGMYIYELRTDKFVSVKKMLLLK